MRIITFFEAIHVLALLERRISNNPNICGTKERCDSDHNADKPRALKLNAPAKQLVLRTSSELKKPALVTRMMSENRAGAAECNKLGANLTLFQPFSGNNTT
nr:hypothetical protein [Photobacterium leiognathi]